MIIDVPSRSWYRSQYSVRTALSPYGTPFFRRYPGSMLVVVTLRYLAAGAALLARLASHTATELPCQVRFAGGAAGFVNWKMRVCVPASVSMRSVLSSCQVT